MKTYSVKASEIKREHHEIDASGQVLGKLASEVAVLLMGKHKPIFSRHIDTGDFVTVTNARKIRVTGNKLQQKMYYRHSGYPGGLKVINLNDMLQKHPERVIEYAVKGMLPDNKLRARMMRRLRVYAGEKPAASQQPAVTVIDDAKKGE